MTYEQLEARLLAEFCKTFTEYHKGISTPDGVIEPEWLVQADPQELHDWVRAALRKVRQHTLVEQNA